MVEDVWSERHVLKRILTGLGFSVTAVSNGDEALQGCRESPPDLLLVDWVLKESISGLRLLKRLKSQEQTREIPFIMMSGVKDGPEGEARVRLAGGDLFVAKSEIIDGGPLRQEFAQQVQALVRDRLRPSGDAAPFAPSRKEEVAPVRPAASSDAADPADESAFAHTVLVIDDEEYTAARLNILFRGRPYRLVAASSGEEGLRLAALEAPDLVILDLAMPGGLSGQETCARLREREKESPWSLPIMVLTSDSGSRQEAHCLDLGADDYLPKTAPHERLMARIRSLIRRRRFQAGPKGVLKIGGVSLCMETRELKIADGPPRGLTRTECALLALLMAALGRPVGSRLLVKKLFNRWSAELADLRRLRKHRSNLRKKLGRYPRLIVVLRDEGCRFDMDFARSLSGPSHAA